jgi:hypothetical protein
MIPDITNPHHGQASNLSHDDVLTLAGFTMVGPGLGKAVRERLFSLFTGVARQNGPSAFEMPKAAAAIHESGHAIVMSILGVRVTSVTIDPRAEGGKLFWGGNTEAPELAFADTPASPVGFDTLLNRSRIVYAGIAAELLFAGDDRREGSSLDEVVMSQLLAERAAALIGTNAQKLWEDEVWSWCNVQLLRNAVVHDEIASALLKRGRLKGRRLQDWCAKITQLPVVSDYWPDIQAHTSQLAAAGVTAEGAEEWV